MKFGMGYAYWGNTWQCDILKYRRIGKKLADMGFDMFEISADHLYHMDDQELSEMKKMGKEYALTFSTNSGPSKQYDLSSAEPEVRENGILYFKEIIRKMAVIGSPTLAGAIYSFWPSDFAETDKDAAWERSIPALKEIGDLAAYYGIECSLEVLNRNETYILTNCEEAIEYCKRVDSKGVNILLDTYHMNIEEDNMCNAIRQAGKMLGHFHVGESNRKLPGMNCSLNWEGIGNALRDIGYSKGVVMEPFLITGGEVGRDIRVWRDLSGGADETQMDEYLRKSLKFLKSKFER